MKYVKTRPLDKSDPGFRIPGKQLRWLSSQVSESNPGRIWVVVRKSELPPELVKQLEASNPDLFRGGDTIRRGDLVLGYANENAVSELKEEIKDATNDLESRIKAGPDVKRQYGSYSKVEINEETDATQEILERFKSDKK